MSFTLEISRYWWDGWTWYGVRRMRWQAIIRQDVSPWMIVAYNGGFRTPIGAWRWAHKALRDQVT